MDFHKKNNDQKLIRINGRCFLPSGLGDGLIETNLLKTCAGFWSIYVLIMVDFIRNVLGCFNYLAYVSLILFDVQRLTWGWNLKVYSSVYMF